MLRRTLGQMSLTCTLLGGIDPISFSLHSVFIILHWASYKGHSINICCSDSLPLPSCLAGEAQALEQMVPDVTEPWTN